MFGFQPVTLVWNQVRPLSSKLWVFQPRLPEVPLKLFPMLRLLNKMQSWSFEATLLNMLNISPFTYGYVCCSSLRQWSSLPSSILDITDDELISHFVSINTIASISLAAGYPTLPSVGPPSLTLQERLGFVCCH